MKIPGTSGFEEKTTSRTRAKETKNAGKRGGGVSEKKKSTAQAQSAGNVSLSSRAKEIAKINEIIKSSPDIRTEKVEKIKNEIAKGTYSVDAKDVAEKILKEILSESSFLG